MLAAGWLAERPGVGAIMNAEAGLPPRVSASSAFNALFDRKRAPDSQGLPEDMSTTSLFGGGLIAGDALAALGIGSLGLVATLAAR